MLAGTVYAGAVPGVDPESAVELVGVVFGRCSRPADKTPGLTGDGVLVCPVGHGGQGHLLRTQHGHTEALLPVGFVPLISHS